MPKQYFFEAGSFQDLSYAELLAVFDAFHLNKDCIHRYTDNIFVIKSNDITNEQLEKIFNRLGGFVRYGYIVEDLDNFFTSFSFDGKVTFGISVIGYSQNETSFIKNLANQIKEGLKTQGFSSRYVKPLRGSASLNAAQIVRNGVLNKGFELCILKNDAEELYGCTLGVQNIDDFAQRDLDKPYTDTKMGTLPPKLARIMVNLTGKLTGTIWDPFCGSGTVLMESAVLGFDILGSDIDENAIKYSDENIKWLSEKGFIGDIQYDVFNLDVLNPDGRLVSKLKKTEISAVVCEPFMGPPQHYEMYPNRAEVLLKKVKALYTGLFHILEKIVREGFIVVLIVPGYKTHSGWRSVGIREIIEKRWEVLNSKYSSGRDLKWSRKNSIITRNIFILRKR